MSSLQILEARIKDELENLNKLLSEAEAIKLSQLLLRWEFRLLQRIHVL